MHLIEMIFFVFLFHFLAVRTLQWGFRCHIALKICSKMLLVKAAHPKTRLGWKWDHQITLVDLIFDIITYDTVTLYLDGLWNFLYYSIKILSITQVDDLRHCFFPFFWCSLNGLQLFLRVEVSQKSPEANACWSHSSNSFPSSSIISASKSQGYLLDFERCVFSKPTMFTWKLGLWVLGLHAIPCNKQFFRM